jgi:hypothetical protein
MFFPQTHSCLTSYVFFSNLVSLLQQILQYWTPCRKSVLCLTKKSSHWCALLCCMNHKNEVSLTFQYSHFSIFLKFRPPFEALVENHFLILVLFFFQLTAVTWPTQYPSAAYYISLPLSSPVRLQLFVLWKQPLFSLFIWHVKEKITTLWWISSFHKGSKAHLHSSNQSL